MGGRAGTGLGGALLLTAGVLAGTVLGSGGAARAQTTPAIYEYQAFTSASKELVDVVSAAPGRPVAETVEVDYLSRRYAAEGWELVAVQYTADSLTCTATSAGPCSYTRHYLLRRTRTQ